MKSFYNAILNTVSIGLPSDFEHYQITLLTFLLQFAVVGTIVSFLVYPLNDEPMSVQLMRIAGFSSNFVLYPLRRRHYKLVAMAFLYGQLYFVIFTTVIILGRLEAVPYLLLIPVASLHLFTFRQAIVTSAIHIGILLLLPLIANVTLEDMRGDISLAVIFTLLTIATIVVRDKTIRIIQSQAMQIIDFETQKQVQKQSERRHQYIREISKYISHDIRTPLSSINASQYLLQRLQTNSLADKYLINIAEAVAHITSIVDDINQLSMVEEGKSFEFEIIDLKQLISLAIDTLNRSLTTQRIFNLSPLEDDHYIWGDHQLIKLLITKILYNSVIYSDDDTVINVEISSNTHGTVLQIIDQGIGIPEDELSSIFEPFYKCDKARTVNASHSGLGLTIAKKLIEFHGGTIHVESELGVGSTFILEFPLPPSDTGKPSEVSQMKGYKLQSMLPAS